MRPPGACHDRFSSAGGGHSEVDIDVFAAMGYADDRPVSLRLEAFPTRPPPTGVQFLRGGAVTGKPLRVLTDDGIRLRP
jgi:hypothetical protein